MFIKECKGIRRLGGSLPLRHIKKPKKGACLLVRDNRYRWLAKYGDRGLLGLSMPSPLRGSLRDYRTQINSSEGTQLALVRGLRKVDLRQGLQNTSMYFALRAMLRMFKFVPDEFVLGLSMPSPLRDHQHKALMFTKIDWINFEHHVLCDGPQGELQGSSE